ncbi:MAG: phenylalanine--tRNA ligase subunit beta [Thermofilaceae archaeon]
MPVCRVALFDLDRLVGREVGQEELENLLPRLKCEFEAVEGGYVVYEATHDRPDLFSAEGLSRALKGLLRVEEGLRAFRIEKVGEAINEGPAYRPYVLLATVHGLELDDEAISQIMQLQEKLHATYGRDRRKVSIGVYDLSRVKFPIRYLEADPGAVAFTPLEFGRELSLREILKHHPKGVQYGHLLAGKARFPILVDGEGKVLSMPPIVNSEDSKVTEKTVEVLVDVTATDLKAAKEVLAVMVTSIAERGEKIGLVAVHSRDGVHELSLEPSEMLLEPELLERVAGLKLQLGEIVGCLRLMRFDAEVRGQSIAVRIPAYRIDILHPVDLVEEVVMGYGFDRLTPELMPPQHAGGEAPIEVFSRKLRELMVGFGFQEVQNYMLTCKEVLYTLMEAPELPTVEVENPKQAQFSCLRTWLTPLLLQVLSRSKHADYPQRIFECGDVVLLDEEAENRVREERRLAFAHSDSRATLTEVLAVVKELMRLLRLECTFKREEHPSFIKGRYALIVVDGEQVGFAGEVHPKVLVNWGLEKPVAVAELNLSILFRLLSAPQP